MALKIYGASYSVYSRILRLALVEKAIDHEWVETDVFGTDREAQTARRPFGKIPSIDHAGFTLYETGACLRYLEQSSFGPVRLLPDDAKLRARADQIAEIVDSYGYQAMIWDVYVELRKTSEGKETDQAVVERGMAVAARVLDTVEGLADGGDVLVGTAPSHADLYLAPVLAYFSTVEPGRAMIAEHPRLASWWGAWQARPSMAATRYPAKD